MLEGAREAPAAIARQLAHGADAYREFGAALRDRAPAAMLTLARGSSDHAAHFAGYLIMARIGRLVTSLPMSLVTLYHANIACEGLVSMAFSQSGRSPDIVEPTRYFTDGGAATVAFVNDEASPLAKADWSAGLEALGDADRLYVLGRGTGLAIAMAAELRSQGARGLDPDRPRHLAKITQTH
jgi:glucosamine--fructose-6-phosphate aminotransferase (isomerizing)